MQLAKLAGLWFVWRAAERDAWSMRSSSTTAKPTK
jgi:hypothetical protein